MGIFDRLRRLLGGDASPGDSGLALDDLARRIGLDVAALEAFRPVYRAFELPKRTGGKRRILAPNAATRTLQRRLLRRVLARLASHPAAMGFERGRSIVTHARVHAQRAVVLRMDLKDYFASTRAPRVEAYFRKVGWSRVATQVLVRLCTHEGALPTGAPTSPRLSNLVNHRLDARLAGLARRHGATYTRYADDLTFSFAQDDQDAVHAVIGMTKLIVREDGYHLHQKRKLRICRRHQRQLVTGLVVNARVQLPRATRRWLRAVEHRVAAGRPTTLTDEQLAGWRALASMVAAQGGDQPQP